MGIAERLKKARETAGKSQKDMALACGASYRMWQAYESDENPPNVKTIEALAKMGFNINWVLTGEGAMLQGEASYQTADGLKTAGAAGEILMPPVAVRPKFWENEDDLNGDYYLIPRYDVRADCGSGAVVESEQVIDRLAFVKSWVNAHHQPSDLFLITAQGHSMTPTINEGDILLVDKSRRRPSADGVYVLSVDHELIAKRLQRLYDGTVKIVSDNKAYDEQLVPADQTDKLDIIGQVVWKGGRV